MTTSRLAETTAIRHCHLCLVEVPACDNYCRRCGTHQQRSPTGPAKWQEEETKRVLEIETTYQSLSSPVVNLLAQTVTARASALRGNPTGTRMVAVLAALPIWLLIILLSPLDAYAAAKAVSKQMDYQ